MESPSAAEYSNTQYPNDSFVCDEQSQLYFHASSGFYHDPNAGWYYSTLDGLYYKFQDGNYLLLEGDDSETNQTQVTATENSIQEESFSAVGEADYSGNDTPENHPPPSEWLEDTLIELYLSGYSNLEANAADDKDVSDGKNDSCDFNVAEMIDVAVKSSEGVCDEGGSWDEENWRSQYGQVVQDAEVSVPEYSLISLWDWEMVTNSRNDRKSELPRLVGRFEKLSAELHPALRSDGRLLKTSLICEVHLDLVRVTTGGDTWEDYKGIG